MYGNGIAAYYSDNDVVVDGVWQHIAATKSSTGGVTIYHNGIDVTSADYSSATGNFGTSTTDWLVGGANTVSGADSNINDLLMDELRVYNTVLNASEIIAAAEANNLVPEPSTLTVTELGLWSLGFVGWRRRRR